MVNEYAVRSTSDCIFEVAGKPFFPPLLPCILRPLRLWTAVITETSHQKLEKT